MSDEFLNHQRGLMTPAERFFSITPGAGDLTHVPRALYVGVSGDVVIQDMDGNQVTLVDLAAGVFHPIRCRKVLGATDATNIVGAY